MLKTESTFAAKLWSKTLFILSRGLLVLHPLLKVLAMRIVIIIHGNRGPWPPQGQTLSFGGHQCELGGYYMFFFNIRKKITAWFALSVRKKVFLQCCRVQIAKSRQLELPPGTCVYS